MKPKFSRKPAKLWAPREFWRMPPAARDEITGGCGPGGVGDYFVPDKILFLSVKPACKIHDFMYFFGRTEAHRVRADRVFRNNMLRIIRAATPPGVLRRARTAMAWIYFYAVSLGGGPAFWAGKDDDGERRVLS